MLISYASPKIIPPSVISRCFASSYYTKISLSLSVWETSTYLRLGALERIRARNLKLSSESKFVDPLRLRVVRLLSMLFSVRCLNKNSVYTPENSQFVKYNSWRFSWCCNTSRSKLNPVYSSQSSQQLLKSSEMRVGCESEAMACIIRSVRLSL